MPRVGRSPPAPEPSNRGGGDQQHEMDINDLRRALADQQRVIEQLQQQQTAQNNNQGIALLAEGNFGHFSIRDALEAVPSYDGRNIPFVYFVEGCEEALSMVAPTQENVLVRAIRNKLKGSAHRSILGKTFNNMRELVEFLRAKYGPRETVYEAQGRLVYLYQKKDEQVAEYANRVRELGKRILDAQRRENGQISAEFQNSIEYHLKTSFLRGLNKELTVSREGTLDEIESRAIDAEKELENINMIRRVVLAENSTTQKNAPTRHINTIEIMCQYCQKKGHTADRCRQIPGNEGNSRYINNYSGAPPYQFKPKNFLQNTTNRFVPRQFQQSTHQTFPSNTGSFQRNFNTNQFKTTTGRTNQSEPIMCNYCKKFGHIIEECRKREYNNKIYNKQINQSNQGNRRIPEPTGATSGKTSMRPSQVIIAEDTVQSEQ